jgi:hypothetical protein
MTQRSLASITFRPFQNEELGRKLVGAARLVRNRRKPKLKQLVRHLCLSKNPKRSELTRIIVRCEFSPPMPTSPLAIIVTLCSILRSRVNLHVASLALPSNWCSATLGEEAPPN